MNWKLGFEWPHDHRRALESLLMKFLCFISVNVFQLSACSHRSTCSVLSSCVMRVVFVVVAGGRMHVLRLGGQGSHDESAALPRSHGVPAKHWSVSHLVLFGGRWPGLCLV